MRIMGKVERERRNRFGTRTTDVIFRSENKKTEALIYINEIKARRMDQQAFAILCQKIICGLSRLHRRVGESNRSYETSTVLLQGSSILKKTPVFLVILQEIYYKRKR